MSIDLEGFPGRYYTPREWGAKTVGIKSKMRTLPALDVYGHHSVTRPSLNPIADAKVVERIGIQRFGRLSYSWLFHMDGSILEGQGLYRGAHTVDERYTPPVSRNNDAFSFCAMADLTKVAPSDEMLESMAWLAARLRTDGLLRENHGFYAHGDVKATACPGALRDHIPVIRGKILKYQFEVDTSFGYLKIGDTGNSVRLMQQFLNRNTSLALAPDGVFGSATKTAVMEWQTFSGASVDGEWGPETSAATEVALSGQAPLTPPPVPESRKTKEQRQAGRDRRAARAARIAVRAAARARKADETAKSSRDVGMESQAAIQAINKNLAQIGADLQTVSRVAFETSDKLDAVARVTQDNADTIEKIRGL